MGTVVTKLGGTIQPATQRRLVTVLVSALQVRDSCHGGMEGIRWHPSRKPFTHQSLQPAPPQGRTWTGKECLLRSLSDLAVSGPDLLAATLAAAKDGELGRQELLAALLKECRKEKLEYRVVALETTGTILSQLKLDHFKVKWARLGRLNSDSNVTQDLYDIVECHLPKPVAESDKENEMEVDREEGVRQVELQYGILTCLGLAWPEARDTQELYLATMVDHLGALADNTTRRNQLAIAKCIGSLLKAWKLPQHLAKSEQACSEIFAKIAKIISTLLLIPKYAQLRTETLQVLGQAIKLLVESKSADLVYLFRDEITRSLDGVIKDLGSDPSTKTTARDLKTSLNSIQLGEGEAKWAEEKH